MYNINVINDMNFQGGNKMCVQIEKENGSIRVFSDYSKEFIDTAHELNGRWRNGAWYFDEAVEERLIERNPVSKTKVPLEENIKKKTR